MKMSGDVVRKDWYQTESDVVVSLLVKNVQAQDVNVEFTESEVKVNAVLPDTTVFDCKMKLFRTIRPECCATKVLSSKIEIRLRKSEAFHWPSLEEVVKDKEEEAKPAYPSSSKLKKDWNKVEKEVEEELKKDGEGDINSLFSTIYNSGDEDTKKAMIKSLQESGGTVLSTNWDEVGKKKVEVSPPDGMEWKKWE